ncbi:hypothetical protein GIB67_022376 [Kingdonia uniflora]|uniref:Uncharacterized protein n=1 Tax=Kingdonia uniflora TaxID=39325 RepID=A0A7J7N6F7_9MAGN|nr:hypothetical protein GIB67_022376 [Kingdonia uniflora]
MVKTRSMVLEERITSEAQRLMLKYFGDHSLEMALPTPVPPIYQGFSGEETVEAEEDFYYKWKFHVFILTGEERRASLRTLVEDRVRGSYAGKVVVVIEEVVMVVEEENEKGDSAEAFPSWFWVQKIFHLVLWEPTPSPLLAWSLLGVRLGFNRAMSSMRGIYVGRNSPIKSVFKMGRSSVDKVSTASRTNESGSGGEGRLEQFLGFPGRTWNEDVIWVKGNCIQRDDEKLLDLRFRSVKQSVKSTVEWKKSLLDEVEEEETELELVLGELGLSKKKRVESRLKKVVKAQFTRSMIDVDERKRQTSGEEIKMALPASGTTVSGEVTQGKRRRVKPLGDSREKVVEERSASVDDLKEVARLVKGIWLGIEEQESNLKKAKNELEKNLARAKAESLKEIRQLKAVHTVAIGQLQVVTKANLDETDEEHDRLGCHLMLKGYSLEEVDAIKADTYIEEEEEEAEVLGVMDGLDGVSPQTVEEKDSGIKKGLEDLSEVTERAKNLQRQVDTLVVTDDELRVARENLSVLEAAAEHLQTALPAKDMEFREMQRRCDDLNERVPRLKAEKDQAIARAMKAEARESSGGSRTEVKAPLVQGNVRESSGGGEIKAKYLMVKRKEELLKDLPAREELNAEIVRLRARVVDLEATNLAESAQYITKLKEDAVYHDRVDVEIIVWKNNFVRIKRKLKELSQNEIPCSKHLQIRDAPVEL